jgi:hypothetical protein
VEQPIRSMYKAVSSIPATHTLKRKNPCMSSWLSIRKEERKEGGREGEDIC